MTEKELTDLFIRRLTELRMQKGISAREMSLSLGRSESLVNQIENHKIMPSMSLFFQICIFFQIHPKDFFNDKVEYPSLLDHLWQVVSDMSSQQMKSLLSFLESMQ
ncbi:MAG: helix-turn-helix transcriptional regulator [Peptococcaceae bacterium]|nr:helix-turn-helix transcriptional regulator [Peptococcaceae bacterium]